MSATSSFTTVVMTTAIPGILLSGVSVDVEQVLNRLLSEASIQNKNKKILLNKPKKKIRLKIKEKIIIKCCI